MGNLPWLHAFPSSSKQTCTAVWFLWEHTQEHKPQPLNPAAVDTCMGTLCNSRTGTVARLWLASLLHPQDEWNKWSLENAELDPCSDASANANTVFPENYRISKPHRNHACFSELHNLPPNNPSFSSFAAVTLSSHKVLRIPKSAADLLEGEKRSGYVFGFLPLQRASAMPWCHWNASMWEYAGKCSLQAIGK